MLRAVVSRGYASKAAAGAAEGTLSIPSKLATLPLASLRATADNTDIYSKHKTVVQMYTFEPSLAPSAYISPSALIFGEVEVHYKASVWGNSVVRGDANSVKIGFMTSLGEGTSVLTTSRHSTEIGYLVSSGPGVTFQGCTVQGRTIIGAGTTLLEGSFVEPNTIIEPGSVVPQGYTLEGGQVWGGDPVKPIRKLTTDDKDRIAKNCEECHNLAWAHLTEVSPFSTDVFLELEKVTKAAEEHVRSLGMEPVDENPGVYGDDANYPTE